MSIDTDMGGAAAGTVRIVGDLKRRVLRGELLPGEQLRQEDLAKQLGVSRVPLREALLVLSSQGLLLHRQNQGFVVAKRSKNELAQVHLLLSVLEAELDRTMHWPDTAGLKRFEEINDRMANLVDADDWIDLVELNHEFHRSMWKLSPLNLVVNEVERIWGLADAYIAGNYTSRESRAGAVLHHLNIIEAMRAKDRKRLLSVAEEHRNDTQGGAVLAIGG